MNKIFLDLLYKKRSEALNRQAELVNVNAFDGSEGSCHRETHNTEMTGITNQIKVIDEIIERYIGN